MLKRGAKEFSRKDMLWVATGGAEGTQPERRSIEFPYSKYYVMRSDWTQDARYFILKNGRYTAHGHYDSLGFEMFAYGNPIFVDPGIFIYGTPGAVRLISTKSHSTIQVDGANLQNDGGPSQFFVGYSVDYLNAVGPSYQGLDGSLKAVRRVAFLKPDYWVISDVVDGQGEHQVDSRFHYANKDATLDAKTQIATTTYNKGGNLALIPVNAAKLSSTLEEADTAYVHEKLAPALLLRQSVKADLPLRLDNLAYPYKGASSDASITTLTPVADKSVETSGFKIETGGGTDYVVFTKGTSGVAEFKEFGLRVKGQFACVRQDKKGVVKSFAWTWATKLENGELLADSKQFVPGLDVVYDGDVMRITVRGEDPSLRIAVFGRQKASVNGGSVQDIKQKRGMFSPFAKDEPKPAQSVIVDNETAGFVIEKPIKGSSVGGDDQVGYNYYWAHVAPGREGLFSYSPALNSAGVYDVSVYVPKFQLVEITREAHYVLAFRPGGKWTKPSDKCIAGFDESTVASGRVTII
ncbi:MAG: heparinase II/III-family protein, partial [Armatimonadota bacterium]